MSDAIFANSPQPKENDHSLVLTSALNKQDFYLQSFIGTVAVEYIEKALEQTDGNKSKAAKLLGFANYQTLNNWIDKYRICV